MFIQQFLSRLATRKLIIFLLVSNLALADHSFRSNIFWWLSSISLITASGVLVTTGILTGRMNNAKNRIEKIPAVTPDDFITRNNNNDDMDTMINLAYLGTVAAALEFTISAFVFRANYVQEDRVIEALSILPFVPVLMNTIFMAIAIGKMQHSCKTQKVCWKEYCSYNLRGIDRCEYTPDIEEIIAWGILNAFAYASPLITIFSIK